jgi:hypothetical protein
VVLASLPIFGKFLKPATKAIEAGAPVAEKAVSEAEKLFFKLVDAVKNKGIMDKLDRVTGGRLSGAYHEYKGAEVLEDAGSITARFKNRYRCTCCKLFTLNLKKELILKLVKK